MRKWTIGALIPLLVVAACDDDEDSITGTFNLFVSEIEDSCDGVANNDIQSRITIERDGDTFIVTFGDDGVLTGPLDNNGFIQAQGAINVDVTVNGQTSTVPAAMRMQILVPRRGSVQATGRIEYDGTHPSAPGTQCVQTFGATGQRASLSPIVFLSGLVDVA